jgi:undecaprenyl-diphosphatase
MTEVLPISSSGHVAIFQQILNIKADEGILFLILVNIGSMLAIIYHFRKFIFRLIDNFFSYVFFPSTRFESSEGFEYVIKIVIASVPAALLGFFMASTIDSFYQEHYLIIVGAGLLLTATILYIVRNASYINSRQTITYKDALFVGFFQSLAILPGLSRSGITTSSGLFRKMSMETSLNFSFMLYIPISFGSFIRYAIIIIRNPENALLGINWDKPYQLIYYIAAMIASIIATRFALKFMFKLFREGKLIGFAVYTFILGMIAFLTGIITT